MPGEETPPVLPVAFRCNDRTDFSRHLPALLLKMLDIAETCWHERKEPVVTHGLPQTRTLQRAS